ncbi:IclR family transcriptional regulator [Bosea sp. PAMC 26642]|uniref:IclR family transcriptional regulator n=1 Tax=Bosea sp. (strain PAMC 26642) TaxID=1792307 RepID=UPI00076FFA16|nr:IclR family transcriptional regulator [Bosea sp. PAMC 26642]AMJ61555.1 hypothetical protein AXW83_15695 [Bosea sp. PAMC 26642]
MADLSARSGWGGGIDRVVVAIELMAQADGPVRLSDLAATLGVPKSAVHRVLAGLVERGWVERDEGDTYVLTLRLALLGQRLLASYDVDNLRQPILDRLAAQTKELVRLTAVQNGELVWIGSARGRRSGLVYEADMTERVIPFATANGKAWLSTLSIDDAVKICLDAGLGRATGSDKAVKTIPELIAELDLTRSRRYGLAMEEAEQGVAAIAVPVECNGAVVGTMSIAAPIIRLSEDRIQNLLPDLRRASQLMALAWSPSSKKAPSPAKRAEASL